jgi:hypothetical protein
MSKKYSQAPYVRLNFAYILFEEKDYEKAEKEIQSAIKLRPRYSEAYCLLGRVLYEKNDIDKAIECFKKATEIDSDYAEAYYNLGILLKEKRRFEEAEKNFQIAKKLKPSLTELVELASAGTFRGITLRGHGIVETVTLLVIYFPGGVAKVFGEIEEARVKAEKTFTQAIKQKLPDETLVEIPFGTEKGIFDFRTTPNFYLKLDKTAEETVDKTKLIIRKIPDINLRFDPEGVIIEDTEIKQGYSKDLTKDYMLKIEKILHEEGKVVVLVMKK